MQHIAIIKQHNATYCYHKATSSKILVATKQYIIRVGILVKAGI